MQSLQDIFWYFVACTQALDLEIAITPNFEKQFKRL